MSEREPLITTQALTARLEQPGVTLIDATWTYPGGPRPRLEGAIPGAFSIDIDAVSDPVSTLPHMLPPPIVFEAFARAFGVTDRVDVVVYDRMGVVSAPRAWWMFRVMGCRRVQVLDGGLAAWAERGGGLAPATSSRGLRPASSPISNASGAPWRPAMRRFSTCAPPIASRGARRSPVPACVRATCPARSMRHGPTS